MIMGGRLRSQIGVFWALGRVCIGSTVINLAKDPKGYYVALGIAEDASTDDIKSAFRSKAKRLHPDYNPSPIAAKQFHRLHEAYETLSDPTKRAAYDRGWRTVSGGIGSGGMGGGASNNNASETKAKPEPKSQPKPEPPKQEKPKDAEVKRPQAAEQPEMCQCGKITAQPRYIIFDMVWGQLTKTNRKSISGVYCRTCADKAAIRASFITWFAGWWAWPNGPKETVKALINNIRGGRKPPERNAKLLIKQAKAFKARGDMQLARACAEQALAFASNAGLRREVDSLLMSLSSFPARGIKDRWHNPGLTPFIQLAPVIVVAAILSMSLSLSAPMSMIGYVKSAWNNLTAPDAMDASPPTNAKLDTDIRSGRIYAVKTDDLVVRTGPSENYRIDTQLERGSVVMVTEQDSSGRWVRVLLHDGNSGFVQAKGLTPNIDIDALAKLKNFGELPAPKPGAAPSQEPEQDPEAEN